MATFKVESKNKIEIHKKPRVYFTCHPRDFDRFFKKVCADIFETHDCAIYYTADMTEHISQEEQTTDLGRSNLFVIPVTYDLLTKPNRAMKEDIPYALKNHIPILPLMMELDLDTIYSDPTKFGELQYLNPYSTDRTEISYAEKLKKYLESVLIGDEMAKQIRAAFDAYIFLSYRKKDRRYANELMRLIHNNPECQNIAIWFDEFLVPGEGFRKGIEAMMDDCKLFTLLVTPKILEKVLDENGELQDNYVLSVELPLARKNREEKGTGIFAVEMEETDRESLAAIQLEECVNYRDAEFRNRLLEAITRIAVTPNDSPEHNYLIGLAYRDGIDVEVDRQRAVTLITSAANAGNIEAMAELSFMYHTGNGVAPNCHQALHWMKRAADIAVSQRSEDDVHTLNYLYALATLYTDAGQHKEALDLSRRVYNLRRSILGPENPATLSALGKLISDCNRMGYVNETLSLAKKLYALRQELSDKPDKDDPASVHAMSLLAEAYTTAGQYDPALDLQQKVYDIALQTRGEEDPETIATLTQIAYISCNKGLFQEAIRMNTQAYDILCRTLGEEAPGALVALSNLAYNYSCAGQFQEALSRYEKAYAINCRLRGPKHTETLNILNNMAGVYKNFGQLDRALELYKEVYAAFKKALGKSHPLTMTAHSNVGDALSSMDNHIDNLKRAKDIHKEVYALRRSTLNLEHPDTLTSLNNLAYVHGLLGNPQKSLELNRKVYALRIEVLGPEHPYIASTLSNLAHSHFYNGDLQEAIRLEEEAYALSCRILGEEHPDTLICLNSLGFFYLGDEKLDKALELCEKAYTLRRTVLGEAHPSTLLSLGNIANTYVGMNKYEKALGYFELAYRLSADAYGPEHPITCKHRSNLSCAYLACGKLDKAQELIRQTTTPPKKAPSAAGKKRRK